MRRMIKQAVLGTVMLAELEPGNLGDGIRLVGRLQRAGQETFLRHRLRRVLRVDAEEPRKRRRGTPARRLPSIRLAAIARFS